jgi:hypothetical protein
MFSWNESLHVLDSPFVHQQEYFTVHTAMVYAVQVCWQLVSRTICSCSQAVSKLVWHKPLLCVQWKTPDDGQRNCPKYVYFHSKNRFEKLVHLVGFIIRNLIRCTNHMNNKYTLRAKIRLRGTKVIDCDRLLSFSYISAFVTHLNILNIPQVCFALSSRPRQVTLSIYIHASTCLQHSSKTFRPMKKVPLLWAETSSTNYSTTRLLHVPEAWASNLQSYEISDSH